MVMFQSLAKELKVCGPHRKAGTHLQGFHLNSVFTQPVTKHFLFIQACDPISGLQRLQTSEAWTCTVPPGARRGVLP